MPVSIFTPMQVIIMARPPKIDRGGKAAVVVAVRFSRDIIQLLDLIASNRSKFVRDATWEKINKEMEKNATAGE